MWLCRFTGGYTNIIFTYSSFVALQCAWYERVNSRWLNWILRATILGSHWNMHELRILRLLHRRVFWKCDFSCELFILPTCVPLLTLHLRRRCDRRPRPGPGDRRLFSSHTGPADVGPRSPVAGRAPRPPLSARLCVQGCCCRAAWCRWARCSRAAWPACPSCSRATDSCARRP